MGCQESALVVAGDYALRHGIHRSSRGRESGVDQALSPEGLLKISMFPACPGNQEAARRICKRLQGRAAIRPPQFSTLHWIMHMLNVDVRRDYSAWWRAAQVHSPSGGLGIGACWRRNVYKPIPHGEQSLIAAIVGGSLVVEA